MKRRQSGPLSQPFSHIYSNEKGLHRLFLSSLKTRKFPAAVSYGWDKSLSLWVGRKRAHGAHKSSWPGLHSALLTFFTPSSLFHYKQGHDILQEQKKTKINPLYQAFFNASDPKLYPKSLILKKFGKLIPWPPRWMSTHRASCHRAAKLSPT